MRIVHVIKHRFRSLRAFGLVPGIQATKVAVAPTLKESRVAASRMRRFGLPFGSARRLLLSTAILVLCAVAAGYTPAWHASRIAPMRVLRNE